MTEMCGDDVMRVQHFRMWCRVFRNGRMDIRDDGRSDEPSTSVMVVNTA
jgi:hypothetical protein